MAEDLDILICQLRDARPGTRAEAAKTLAQNPTSLAKKDLVRCLQDLSDPVRYWATEALARLRDPSLHPALANQLEDPSASVRMIAARAFHDLPYKRAVQPLMKALADRNDNVAEWASLALSKLGTSVLPQLMNAMAGRSWKRRQMAARTVRRIGPQSLPILEKAIHRQDKNLQYWVLQVLGELKVRSAARLVIPFLGCQDADLLLAAIRAAGELGDRGAVEPLIPLLGHRNENIRIAAVQTLGRFGDYSVKHIADLLSSNRRVLRLSASMTLAASGDTALKSVLDKLTSESLELRYWAVRALERFENPSIIPLLIDLLEDEEFDVQVAAATALRRFELSTDQAQDLVPHLAVENWRVRRAVAEALKRQTHLSPEVFIPALESVSEDTRFWVTKLLPQFCTASAVEALMGRFEDPSWPIRKNAAEGLATMGEVSSSRLVEELEKTDLDANRRYWLSRSLVGNTDSEVIPTLVKLLTDRDSSIRTNAHDALVRFEGRAIRQLLELLKETESRSVRETLAQCIIEAEPEELEILTGMYRFRDPEVNYWISYILGHLGSRAFPELSRMVVHGDERERTQALAALEYMPSKETFKLCVDALEDEFVSIRRKVVRMLGKFGVKEAVPKLIPRLEDADDEYLLSLLEALGKLGGDAALGAILPYLNHERWDVRKQAVIAAGDIGDPRALGALTALMGDETRDLLHHVIAALGKLGTEAVADVVAPFVKDDDVEVRVRAIEAIGAVGATKHRVRIVQLLGSDRWEVVRAALEALGRIGGPVSLEVLKPILAGDDLVLKGVAQRSLKQLLGPEKWSELTEVTIRKTLTEPAREHLDRARALAAEKKNREALSELRKSIRHRKRWDAYALQGTIYLETRELDRAARAFQRALRLEPDEPHSSSKLAVCHLLSGRPDLAEPLLEKILRLPGCPREIATFARRTLGRLGPGVRKG